MQESALLRVRDGTTSLEEAIRILSPAASKTAAPAATGAKPTSTTPPAAGKPAVGKTAPAPSAAKPASPPNKPKASQ